MWFGVAFLVATFIHSPETIFEQLVMLVFLGGTKLSRADVGNYVEQSVDIFVQLSREAGRRRVEAVAWRDQRV